MYYGYGMDPTYFLVLIGAMLCMAASAKMTGTFSRFSRIRSASGLTGQEVARQILIANGIYDVSVQPVAGQLTDHYDPSKKTVNLSEVIYQSGSIAAIGVAAHECGHAIQDNRDYLPLRLRTAIVPVANIGANLSWPLILVGLLLAQSGSLMGGTLLQAGIMMFGLAVLFQLVTLPVEFNASSRALKQLEQLNLLPPEEIPSARAVLGAAALTYVASAASSLLQMLRLVLLFGGNRRRD